MLLFIQKAGIESGDMNFDEKRGDLPSPDGSPADTWPVFLLMQVGGWPALFCARAVVGNMVSQQQQSDQFKI
jgi:hypothetical protein